MVKMIMVINKYINNRFASYLHFDRQHEFGFQNDYYILSKYGLVADQNHVIQHDTLRMRTVLLFHLKNSMAPELMVQLVDAHNKNSKELQLKQFDECLLQFLTYVPVKFVPE